MPNFLESGRLEPCLVLDLFSGEAFLKLSTLKSLFNAEWSAEDLLEAGADEP